MKSAIHFLTDSPPTLPFEGSCSAVSYEIKRCIKAYGFQLAIDHFSLSIPVEERKPISLQPKNESNYKLRIFFEEIYPRVIQDSEFKQSKNIVLFNLYCFVSGVLPYVNADKLVFNSETLKDIFISKMIQFGVDGPKFLEGFSKTSIEVLELFSPAIVFQGGYRSSGSNLSSKIQELSRDKTVVLGHGMRPYKANPIETGLILLNLSNLAKKKGRRIIYALPTENCSMILNAIEQNFGPEQSAMLQEVLLPTPRLNNRALNKLMRISQFSLGYDHVIEAFGFYPLESVINDCPFFTNGIGNLRSLLKSKDGIFVDYPLELYSQSNSKMLFAYKKLAARIYSKIVKKNSCKEAKKEILKRYSRVSFQKRFQKIINFDESPVESITDLYQKGVYALNPLVLIFSKKNLVIFNFPDMVPLTTLQNSVLKKVLNQSTSFFNGLSRPEKKTFSLLWELGILTIKMRKDNYAKI